MSGFRLFAWCVLSPCPRDVKGGLSLEAVSPEAAPRFARGSCPDRRRPIPATAPAPPAAYQSYQPSPASFQILVPGPVAGLVMTCPGRDHPGFG